MGLSEHFLVNIFIYCPLFSDVHPSCLEPLTQQFVRDLLDGFFPSELQKRFPDGVPFNVR